MGLENGISTGHGLVWVANVPAYRVDVEIYTVYGESLPAFEQSKSTHLHSGSEKRPVSVGSGRAAALCAYSVPWD